MTDGALIRITDEKRIRVLELCNPPANGYSHEMMRQLDTAIVEARFEADIDVLVLTGAGDRMFCAGADIGVLSEMTPAYKYQFCLHANETLARLSATNKLVIAAINGHCVGGGLEVALAADLRVCHDGRVRFGLPESKLGVLAGTGGTQRFARLVGVSKAIEWMATGETFGAEKALEIGVVNRILPADNFMKHVIEYASSFTQPAASSSAIALMKLAVQGGIEAPLTAGLALERELQQRLFSAEDAKEGLQAFLEKRPPHFTGKE